MIRCIVALRLEEKEGLVGRQDVRVVTGVVPLKGPALPFYFRMPYGKQLPLPYLLALISPET